MAARTGRKVKLRQIQAKRGWDDGHSGCEADPPKKAVLKQANNDYGYAAVFNTVPWYEEKSYWDAYFEGEQAPPDAMNPYRA